MIHSVKTMFIEQKINVVFQKKFYMDCKQENEKGIINIYMYLYDINMRITIFLFTEEKGVCLEHLKSTLGWDSCKKTKNISTGKSLYRDE